MILKHHGIMLTTAMRDNILLAEGMLSRIGLSHELTVTRGYEPSKIPGHTNTKEVADLSLRGLKIKEMFTLAGVLTVFFRKVLMNCSFNVPHIHVEGPRNNADIRSLWSIKNENP